MNRNHYRTPKAVVDAIERFLNLSVGLDACASPENAVCSRYFTEADNALEQVWHCSAGEFVFFNPPYSKIMPWVSKAVEQSIRSRCVIVGVLPDDRSTVWYRSMVQGMATLELIPFRRISFLHPETGQPVRGNPKGTVIPVWTPWRTGRTETVTLHVETKP